MSATTPTIAQPSGVPTFDELLAILSDIVGRDLRMATPDHHLVDDLMLDSLAMTEALALFAAFGADLHDDMLAGLRTVGDLHHYLQRLGEPGTVEQMGAHHPFRGVNIQLQPVDQRHYDWLFELCATGRHLIGYRLRAMTPAPEAFHRFLWDKVLTQFVVHTDAGVPVGLVSCFEPDFRNRYAYLAAVADPERDGDGLVLEGMTVLISYLFAQFDLRKLYLESLEPNFAAFASGTDRIFDIEGRLRGHEYLDGTYQDFILAAVWRDPWRDHHQRILGTAPPY